MVVDTLENLEKYASLNPLFAQAIEFLKSHDLQAMEIGKTELKGKDLLVNIAQTKPKTKEEAKLETHNEFIDIQLRSRCLDSAIKVSHIDRNVVMFINRKRQAPIINRLKYLVDVHL